MAQKFEQLVTPRGTFVYPHLTVADDKFVKPHGEFHTKFALNVSDGSTEQFIAKLEDILDAYVKSNPDELKPAALKKSRRADVFEQELDDEGEETGRVIFKFKLKAVDETRSGKTWSQNVKVVGADNRPIDPTIQIWTGSEGKVITEIFPYYMSSTKEFGLSLRVKAAQILKLVEGGSGGDLNFDVEEDGYVSDAPDFSDDAGDSDDGEDEGEF